MTGFMSFKLKICENINLYNYTMYRIFLRSYMVMIFQFKKYLTKNALIKITLVSQATRMKK